ncbi:MAG: hypothetical protein Q8Q90_03105 [bacterium]|nr:hypothetical protein [bacterium]
MIFQIQGYKASGKKDAKKMIIRLAVVLVLSFAMRLVTRFTNEVSWDEANAYGVILLALWGFYETLQWLKRCPKTYRIAFGIGFTGMLFLGWVSGAVGIIGSENNPANLMYWAVFAVALVGSIISRFNPRGMAYALFATAFVQFLVPVVALFIWPAKASWGEAGVIHVFVFNSIFALVFFAGSALLFRRVALEKF